MLTDVPMVFHIKPSFLRENRGEIRCKTYYKRLETIKLLNSETQLPFKAQKMNKFISGSARKGAHSHEIYSNVSE